MFTSLNLVLGFPKGVNHPDVQGGITGGTYCFHRSYTACIPAELSWVSAAHRHKAMKSDVNGHFSHPAAQQESGNLSVSNSHCLCQLCLESQIYLQV